MAPLSHAKNGRRQGTGFDRDKVRTSQSDRERLDRSRIRFNSPKQQENLMDDNDSDVLSSTSDDPAISEQSESDDTANDDNKPYNTLLQALSSRHDTWEPSSKRLKIEDPREPSSQDNVEDEEEQDNVGYSDMDEESDIDEIETYADPFVRQSSDNQQRNLLSFINSIQERKWRTQKSKTKNSYVVISKEPEGMESVLRPPKLEIKSFYLKERIREMGNALLSHIGSSVEDLLLPINHYQDVLFPLRSPANAKSLRNMLSLHIINHVYKTRDKIVKNTARLTKGGREMEDEYRDQGFTRPKILVILPTRQACARYVESITEICRPEQQENKKRFQDSYTTGEGNISESKPADFRELFSGNDDDMFRMGLKFTRKTIKFFAQFYNSDIIFASPLGLRMAMGSEDTKKQDFDFLSSIEIVIMDQADALSMQNWEHVDYIFEHLNLQPKEAHGCDFSRVKNWYLDGHARYLRQTVLISAFNFPALNKLYSQQMLNVAGKSTYLKEEKGAMLDIATPVRQTFSRFDCLDPAAEPDSRFKHFLSTILPSLAKSARSGDGPPQGILLFVPVYADFVRIRNHLASSTEAENIAFGSISEYAPVRDVARARSHFTSGKHSLLLYTERAHHFRRYHIKGVKKIVMYGLPENPLFYKEIVGGFLDSTVSFGHVTTRETSVRVLFSKWDVLKLERIVGSSRYVSMLKDKAGDTFDFL